LLDGSIYYLSGKNIEQTENTFKLNDCNKTPKILASQTQAIKTGKIKTPFIFIIVNQVLFLIFY
jgi:hypothetical protein